MTPFRGAPLVRWFQVELFSSIPRSRTTGDFGHAGGGDALFATIVVIGIAAWLQKTTSQSHWSICAQAQKWSIVRFPTFTPRRFRQELTCFLGPVMSST